MLALALMSCLFIAAAQLWAANAARGRVAHSVDGVPAEAITLDYAGFDTFDSCARAHDIFGVRAAVVITQDFHATRAVATCRAAGIDAVGLARSTAGYSRVEVRALELRERAATAKALWDDVSGGQPHFLGEFVGLPGSTVMPTTNQWFDDRLVAGG